VLHPDQDTAMSRVHRGSLFTRWPRAHPQLARLRIAAHQLHVSCASNARRVLASALRLRALIALPGSSWPAAFAHTRYPRSHRMPAQFRPSASEFPLHLATSEGKLARLCPRVRLPSCNDTRGLRDEGITCLSNPLRTNYLRVRGACLKTRHRCPLTRRASDGHPCRVVRECCGTDVVARQSRQETTTPLDN